MAGEVLRAAGIEAPRLEARLLLGHALGLSQEALLRDRDAVVPAGVFDALVARRAAREPLALIVGRKEFWGLDLAVSPATLIPRPETETLIEAAIEAFPERCAVRCILDLGTGTGALLLAALAEFPRAFGVGVDLNPAAAMLAAGNAARLGLAPRAAFLSGDWATALAGRFDLVLSNPPYIASGEIAGLMPEVARFEPHAALDGGPDGLGAYRHVIADLPRLLAATGTAILELGAGQADAVGAIAGMVGFSPDLRADLGGIRGQFCSKRLPDSAQPRDERGKDVAGGRGAGAAPVPRCRCFYRRLWPPHEKTVWQRRPLRLGSARWQGPLTADSRWSARSSIRSLDDWLGRPPAPTPIEVSGSEGSPPGAVASSGSVRPPVNRNA